MKAIVIAAALVPLALGACNRSAPDESANNSGATNTSAMTDTGVNRVGMNGTDLATNGIDGSNAMSAAQMPADAATYVAKAGAGDMFEIESSKALLAKSKDAKVRDFAQMMVSQHQQSTANIKAAAAQAKVSVVTPALAPDQQTMLDEIKSATPATIDAIYLRDQRTAHDQALALHKNYAAHGDQPALKKAAGEIVPIVSQHLDHLAKLSAQ